MKDLARRSPHNPAPDAVSYTIAIDACARVGDSPRAVALLHEMQHQQGLPPNPIAYSAAVNACAKARDGRAAMRLVEEMGERGLPVNEVVYAAAMQALNLSEEDDAALLGLYDEMRVRRLYICLYVGLLTWCVGVVGVRFVRGCVLWLLLTLTCPIEIHTRKQTQTKGLRMKSNDFGAAIKVCTCMHLFPFPFRFPLTSNHQTPSSINPTKPHTNPNPKQACDRSQAHLRAVEIGEAMLAAGLSPLPRTVTCVLRGADRARLYERVGWGMLLMGVCVGGVGVGVVGALRRWMNLGSVGQRRAIPHLTRSTTNRASPSCTPRCPWRPRRWASKSPSTWRPRSGMRARSWPACGWRGRRRPWTHGCCRRRFWCVAYCVLCFEWVVMTGSDVTTPPTHTTRRP